MRCAKYSTTKCWPNVDEQRSAPCLPRLSFSSTGRGAAVQPSRRPGDEDLRERAEVDDVLAAVERVERRQRVALVAQQPVRVVLEHEQLALGGEPDEPAAALERHRDAGRVLERRHRVDELRRAALALEPVERLLEQVDAHAVGVHLDLHDVGLVGAERGHGAGIGRALGDDHVARIDQRLADEVDHLLAAGRDEQLVRRRRPCPPRPSPRRCRPSARPCPPSARTGARARRRRRRRAPSARRRPRPGTCVVSGSPPASEMTSGRAVIAIRSRMAEDFMPWVRRANSPA